MCWIHAAWAAVPERGQALAVPDCVGILWAGGSASCPAQSSMDRMSSLLWVTSAGEGHEGEFPLGPVL